MGEYEWIDVGAKETTGLEDFCNGITYGIKVDSSIVGKEEFNMCMMYAEIEGINEYVKDAVKAGFESAIAVAEAKENKSEGYFWMDIVLK